MPIIENNGSSVATQAPLLSTAHGLVLRLELPLSPLPTKALNHWEEYLNAAQEHP